MRVASHGVFYFSPELLCPHVTILHVRLAACRIGMPPDPDPEAAEVGVWDMDNQKWLGSLEGHNEVESAFSIVAARGNIAVSDHRSGPRLWNLETLQCTATLPAADPEGDNVLAAYITGDKVFLGCEGYSDIMVWNIAADAPVALANLAGHAELDVICCIRASEVTALSGSSDTTIRLWDLRTGNSVRTMEGHSATVCSVDMDGSCRTAVSGCYDRTFKLWDLGSGRCMETYEGHSIYSADDVVMHESGSSFLSSGQNDYSVKTWVVGSTKAKITADFTASSPPNSNSRLFASRDLSRVAYCCLSEGQIELKVWK